MYFSNTWLQGTRVLYLTLGQENGKEKRKAPFILQKVMKDRGAWWHKADCSGTRLLTMPEELTSRWDKRDTHRLTRQLLECLVSYLSPWKRSSEEAFDGLMPGLKLLFIILVPHRAPLPPTHFILTIHFFPHGIYSLPPCLPSNNMPWWISQLMAIDTNQACLLIGNLPGTYQQWWFGKKYAMSVVIRIIIVFSFRVLVSSPCIIFYIHPR